MIDILMSVRLSLDELERLDAIAERERCTRSEIVRRCVSAYIARGGRL